MQEEQQVQFVPLNAIGLRNPRKKYLRRQKGSNKGRVVMWSGKKFRFEEMRQLVSSSKLKRKKLKLDLAIDIYFILVLTEAVWKRI